MARWWREGRPKILRHQCILSLALKGEEMVAYVAETSEARDGTEAPFLSDVSKCT